MSIIDKIVSEKVPHWTCPDCGTLYFGAVSPFRFCPACRDKQAVLEKQYWDNKAAGMRSVTGDIVAKILAKGGTYGNSQ